MMEPMPDRTNKKSKATKVYLPSRVILHAKNHATRNGFTLSGWVTLLVKKALEHKTDPKAKTH